MCGIVGFFGRNGYRDFRYNEIESMVNSIYHRGPDDQGMVGIDLNSLVAEKLVKDKMNPYDGMMGFCRLSIRDLSENGHQPMATDDKKVVICFNGEIYNADYYRDLLKTKGYVFKGFSDTEVILNLYIEYGIEETATKLNGMFAFVICDLRKKCVWLVRDRVGIKPLYYAITEKRIAYASEVKAFLEIEEFERRISKKNLTEVMTFCRPSNSVLLDGVEQVMPGHIIRFSLDSFNKSDITFFDINDYERPTVISEDQYMVVERAKELLFKCTDSQKVSDVKVGCQLSGGVDSSLITYAAAEYGENKLKDTISIVFDEQKEFFSEEQYVDVVVDKLGIQAHNQVMNCDYFLKNYEKVIWHADTVIGRSNSIGLFLISEAARKYVTVLLSGEGADELLGGYDMFKMGCIVSEQLKMKDNSDGIWVEVVPRQKELIHSFAEFTVMAQQKSPEDLCKKLMPGFDSTELMKEKIALVDSFIGSDFDKQIKYSISSYLQELLVAQDKMSMANSIENRVPILDNEFIDFAFSVPKSMLMKEKDGKLQGKYILKQIAAELFGEDFAYRKKMGFPFPFFNYMKEEKFREYFYDVILEGTKKRGIFDAKELENYYVNLHWSNPATVRETFWRVCGVEAWCQMFVDGRKPISIV